MLHAVVTKFLLKSSQKYISTLFIQKIYWFNFETCGTYRNQSVLGREMGVLIPHCLALYGMHYVKCIVSYTQCKFCECLLACIS